MTKREKHITKSRYALTLAHALRSNDKKLSLSNALKKAWKYIKNDLHFAAKVAGVTFENRQKLIERLKNYSKDQVIIAFQHEKDNPVDPSAVAVVAKVIGKGKAKIGYVSASMASVLAKLLDKGLVIRGGLESINNVPGQPIMGVTINYTFKPAIVA